MIIKNVTVIDTSQMILPNQISKFHFSFIIQILCFPVHIKRRIGNIDKNNKVGNINKIVARK